MSSIEELKEKMYKDCLPLGERMKAIGEAFKKVVVDGEVS